MMNSSGLRDRVRKKKVNNTVFISKVIEYQREMNDSKKEKIKSYTQYIYIYIIQKFVSREYYLLKERISSLPPRNHSTFFVKTKPRETFKWPPSSGTTRWNNGNPYEHFSPINNNNNNNNNDEERGKNPGEEYIRSLNRDESKSSPEWRERDKKGWSRDKEGLHQLFLSMHQPSR